MSATRRVNYNGAELTLRELASVVGISYSCLDGRYRKGDREPALWRPLDCVGGNKAGKRPPSVLRGEGVSIKTREQEAARREQQLARKQREAETRARLMVEHAAAFARPLIDAGLLKPKEHLAIVERVKFSGQKNWRTDGGATF